MDEDLERQMQATRNAAVLQLKADPAYRGMTIEQLNVIVIEREVEETQRELMQMEREMRHNEVGMYEVPTIAPTPAAAVIPSNAIYSPLLVNCLRLHGAMGRLQWLPITAGVTHWDPHLDTFRARVSYLIDTIRSHAATASLPPFTTASRTQLMSEYSVISVLYRLAQERSHVLQQSVDQCLAACTAVATATVDAEVSPPAHMIHSSFGMPHESKSKSYALTTPKVLQLGLILEHAHQLAATATHDGKSNDNDDDDEYTDDQTYAHITSELHRLLVHTGIATSITTYPVAMDWSTSHGITNNMVYPLGATELDWLRAYHKHRSRRCQYDPSKKQVARWQPMSQLYTPPGTPSPLQPPKKAYCGIPFYMIGSSKKMDRNIGDVVNYQYESPKVEHGLTICRAIIITLTPIWLVISRALPLCLTQARNDTPFIDIIVCYLCNHSTWYVDDHLLRHMYDDDDDDDDDDDIEGDDEQ